MSQDRTAVTKTFRWDLVIPPVYDGPKPTEIVERETFSDQCGNVPGCVRVAGHQSFHTTSEAIARKEDAQLIDYNEIDPGIRHVVKALNDAGHETSDSGDGSKAKTGFMECVIEYPHVAGVFQSGSLCSSAALVASVQKIAMIATYADGESWDCEVGYSTSDDTWTWFAHPSGIGF